MKSLGAICRRAGSSVSRLCETHEQQLSREVKEERLRNQELRLLLQQKSKEAKGGNDIFSNGQVGTSSNGETSRLTYLCEGRPPPACSSESSSTKPGCQLSKICADTLHEPLDQDLVKWHRKPSVGTWLQPRFLEPPTASNLRGVVSAHCEKEEADAMVISLPRKLQESQDQLRVAVGNSASLEKKVSLLVADVKRKEEELQALNARQDEDIRRVIRAKDCELEELRAQQREDAQFLVQAKDIEVSELNRALEEGKMREAALKLTLQRKDEQISLLQQASKDANAEDKEINREINTLLKEVQSFKDREAASRIARQRQEELLHEQEVEIRRLKESELSLKNLVQQKELDRRALTQQGAQQENGCNGTQGSHVQTPSQDFKLPVVQPQSPQNLEQLLRRQERALCEKEEQVASLVSRQEKELRVAYCEVQTLRRELQVVMAQKNSFAEEAKAKESELQAAQKRHFLELKLKDTTIRNLHDTMQSPDNLAGSMSARYPRPKPTSVGTER